MLQFIVPGPGLTDSAPLRLLSPAFSCFILPLIPPTFFFLTSGQAKAGAAEAVGGIVPVAVSGPDKPAEVEPTAAAQNPVRATRWSYRIDYASRWIIAKPIGTPLQYVPMHLV